jgi:deoxyribonuclease V
VLFENKEELLKLPETKESAEEIQSRWCDFLFSSDFIEPQINDLSQIQTIVGVDISYFTKDGKEYGVACAVLWDYVFEKELDHIFFTQEILFPYIPGFLGFREVPLLYQVINNLFRKPDAIMCDGQGYAHPRRFGEAVHLGVLCEIPSIGIAKSHFIGDVYWKNMKKIKGNQLPMMDHNEVIGYAIVLADKQKPAFLSRGFGISLNYASELALKTTSNHQQPDPLFLADFYSRQELNKLK